MTDDKHRAMDKWKAESRRMRAGIKQLPPNWPFHRRPDLQEEHDRLAAEGRRLLAEAAALRALALRSKA